jgi:hypothetical protein
VKVDRGSRLSSFVASSHFVFGARSFPLFDARSSYEFSGN